MHDFVSNVTMSEVCVHIVSELLPEACHLWSRNGAPARNQRIVHVAM